jgi:dihydroxyacid dehydratase/phosphogluconate dehydratase
MHAMRRMLAGLLAIVGQAIGPVCKPQYPVHDVSEGTTQYSRQCTSSLLCRNILTMSMFVYKMQQVQGMPRISYAYSLFLKMEN